MLTPLTLRVRREHLGYSVEAFAEALDVDPRNVRRWEYGHRDIPAGIADELRALEEAAEREVDRLHREFETLGVIVVSIEDAESASARAVLGRVLADLGDVAVDVA